MPMAYCKVIQILMHNQTKLTDASSTQETPTERQRECGVSALISKKKAYSPLHNALYSTKANKLFSDKLLGKKT